jgi:hypothetical protein
MKNPYEKTHDDMGLVGSILSYLPFEHLLCVIEKGE